MLNIANKKRILEHIQQATHIVHILLASPQRSTKAKEFH